MPTTTSPATTTTDFDKIWEQIKSKPSTSYSIKETQTIRNETLDLQAVFGEKRVTHFDKGLVPLKIEDLTSINIGKTSTFDNPITAIMSGEAIGFRYDYNPVTHAVAAVVNGFNTKPVSDDIAKPIEAFVQSRNPADIAGLFEMSQRLQCENVPVCTLKQPSSAPTAPAAAASAPAK